MPQVTRIDAYTHQNLDNEIMMPIVDKYPELWFGWLVRLGKAYKIRSDCTAFSTRKGPSEPFYTSEDLEVLRYVPGLKAIDVGHNHVDDLHFLTYFDDLRLLILADNNITDISVLSQFKNLEYLELFMNDITDVTPPADLIRRQTSLKVASSIRAMSRARPARMAYSCTLRFTGRRSLSAAYPRCWRRARR